LYVVLELTGSKSRIVHLPPPQDDPKQRQPDIRGPATAGDFLQRCRVRPAVSA